FVLPALNAPQPTLFPYTTLFRSPTSGSTWNSLFEFPNKPDLAEDDRVIDINYVTPGWFETYNTPIRSGRDIEMRDVYGTPLVALDRKSTRLNSSHVKISYAVFCL